MARPLIDLQYCRPVQNFQESSKKKTTLHHLHARCCRRVLIYQARSLSSRKLIGAKYLNQRLSAEYQD
jgi:hypothetical protein